MPQPVIIVTGASRGIGRAIAEELQARGAFVVGAARNVAELPASNSLLPVAADVAQDRMPGAKRCSRRRSGGSAASTD